MSVFNMGATGLIQQLLDRLTAARAAKLDNLNDDTATLAKAATALSTTNWPEGRAELLALISQLSGGLYPKTLSRSPYIQAEPTTDPDVYNTANRGWGVWVTNFTGAPSNVYETLFQATGNPGIVYFLGFVIQGPSNPDIDLRITMDGGAAGNVHLASHPTEQASRDVGFTLAGSMSFDNSGIFQGINFAPFRYKSDLLVECRRNADTTAVKILYSNQVAD